ncbi:Hypothetical predicted protein [Octopus vulgaris]|uniref:Uncharacterized protein n=1 Tax=Octopus vulgaris TaxID=6645 RepID=A0AA36AXK9_OCTVU|nr:Hypothetical predicted protein [Octopus vulgaris]
MLAINQCSRNNSKNHVFEILPYSKMKEAICGRFPVALFLNKVLDHLKKSYVHLDFIENSHNSINNENNSSNNQNKDISKNAWHK